MAGSAEVITGWDTQEGSEGGRKGLRQERGHLCLSLALLRTVPSPAQGLRATNSKSGHLEAIQRPRGLQG